MGNAKHVTLIVTDLESRGAGVIGDPHRRVTQYWTTDGELVFEDDPNKDRRLQAEHVLKAADEMMKAAESYFEVELPEGKHWDYLKGRIFAYQEARKRLPDA